MRPNAFQRRNVVNRTKMRRRDTACGGGSGFEQRGRQQTTLSPCGRRVEQQARRRGRARGRRGTRRARCGGRRRELVVDAEQREFGSALDWVYPRRCTSMSILGMVHPRSIRIGTWWLRRPVHIPVADTAPAIPLRPVPWIPREPILHMRRFRHPCGVLPMQGLFMHSSRWNEPLVCQ